MGKQKKTIACGLAVLILLTGAWQFALCKDVIPKTCFGVGGIGNDGINDNCFDSQNNVIAVMTFQNSFDCDPGKDICMLESKYADSIGSALVKYDNTGKLLWAINVMHFSQKCILQAVAVDSKDNIIVAGHFGSFTPSGGLVNLCDIVGIQMSLFYVGLENSFIAKYDKDGYLMWGASFGERKRDNIWDVEVDSQDNIVITGFFKDRVNLSFKDDGDYFLDYSKPDYAIFIAKYKSNGSIIWGKQFPSGSGEPMDEIYTSICIDEKDEILFGGNFKSKIVCEIDKKIIEFNSMGETDIFFSKLTKNGEFLWFRQIGGKFEDSIMPDSLKISPIEKNIYITGNFKGTSDFNPLDGTLSLQAANIRYSDLFVASYTFEGKIRWAFSVYSENGSDSGCDIDFDESDDIYVCGWFKNVGDFDPSPNKKILKANGQENAGDIFIAKYDKYGNLIFAYLVGNKVIGTDSTSSANTMLVDSNQELVVSGKFCGKNVDFNSISTPFALDSKGKSDAFIARYNRNGKLVYLE